LPAGGQLTDSGIVNLPAGTYTVCLSDSNQCIVCESAEVLEDPLSVNSGNETGRIIIFPNPSEGNLMIRDILNSSENLRVRIEDMYGKRIDFYFTGAGSFDLSTLSTGIYNLSVFSTHGKVSSQRVIISR
jgi:hypothetical protein